MNKIIELFLDTIKIVLDLLINTHLKKAEKCMLIQTKKKCNLLLIILSGHKQFVKQECHRSSRPIRGISTTEHYGSGCTGACDCATSVPPSTDTGPAPQQRQRRRIYRLHDNR